MSIYDKYSSDGGNSTIDQNHPAVRQLLADPMLRKAVMDGELGRFATMIDNFHLNATDPEYIEALEYIRERPQLFARPVTSNPYDSGFSILGCGIKVHGAKNKDRETGLYTSTKSLSLFTIPLIPLSRFLGVTIEGRQMGVGKIKLSVAQKLWLIFGGLFGLPASFCVASSMLILLLADSDFAPSTDVHIINGFDQPVHIAVDEENTYIIEAREMKEVAVKRGDYTFESTFEDGTVIEEIDFEVPRYTNFTAYNIAGVGTPYKETVVYYDDSEFEYIDGEAVHTGEIDPREDFQPLLGQRRLVFTDIDHIDEEPPEEMDIYSSRPARTAFYYEGESLNEARWQFEYDEDIDPEKHTKVMDEAFSTLVKYSPEQQDLVFLAIDQSMSVTYREAWIQTLTETALANPDVIWLNLIAQRLRQNFGDLNELSADYEALHEEHGTPKTALYLAVLENDGDARHELLEMASELDTDDTFFNDEMGFQFARLNECDTALQHLERSIKHRVHRFGDDHYIPYGRCLFATDDSDGTEPASTPIKTFIQEIDALPDYYVDYPLTTFYARLITTEESSLPPRASQVPSGVSIGLGEYGDEWSMNYLYVDSGIILDETYRDTLYEMTPDAEPLFFDFYDSIAAGDHERALMLYRKDFQREYAELTHSIERDVKVLFALISIASGDPSLFNHLHTGALESSALDLHYTPLQPAAYILRDIGTGSGPEFFEGDAPSHWDPEYRAAYYVAQSTTVDSKSDKEQSLQRALDEDPIWGSVQLMASKMLENL